MKFKSFFFILNKELIKNHCISDSSNEISSENLSNKIIESNEDLLSNEADLSDTALSAEIDKGKSQKRTR